MKNLQHNIQVNIRAKDGVESPIIAGKVHRVRERLLRLLFGEAREIVVLKPGESVKSLIINETEEKEKYED